MPRQKEPDAGPHPLDIALGARVRLRRKELGFSQIDLARKCGITFQQVQKYEHGTNRISFSRLVEMAHALQTSLADLIGKIDGITSSRPIVWAEFLADPDANELLLAYVSMSSRKSRRALLNLARQVARDDDEHVYSSTRRAKNLIGT
jgi:transcriptional regulator with XRE-family HTH domain